MLADHKISYHSDTNSTVSLVLDSQESGPATERAPDDIYMEEPRHELKRDKSVGNLSDFLKTSGGAASPLAAIRKSTKEKQDPIRIQQNFTDDAGDENYSNREGENEEFNKVVTFKEALNADDNSQLLEEKSSTESPNIYQHYHGQLNQPVSTPSPVFDDLRNVNEKKHPNEREVIVKPTAEGRELQYKFSLDEGKLLIKYIFNLRFRNHEF